MVSPICTVNGSSVTNGFNTTPGVTVTIALVDTAGVNYWSLTCYSTSNKESISAVNAAISINQTNKTATLTIPSSNGGCAIILESKVNNGIDLHGIIQESYSITFGIFSIGTGNNRLIATKQTIEGSANFGWIKDLNLLLDGSALLNPDFGSINIISSGTASVGSVNTTNIAGSNVIAGAIINSLRTVDGYAFDHEGNIINNEYLDATVKDFAIVVNDAVSRPGRVFNVYLPAPVLGRMIIISNNTDYTTLIHPNGAELVNFGSTYDPGLKGCTFVSDGSNWFLTHPHVTAM